jgi:hypothetical protein
MNIREFVGAIWNLTGAQVSNSASADIDNLVARVNPKLPSGVSIDGDNLGFRFK